MGRGYYGFIPLPPYLLLLPHIKPQKKSLWPWVVQIVRCFGLQGVKHDYLRGLRLLNTQFIVGLWELFPVWTHQNWIEKPLSFTREWTSQSLKTPSRGALPAPRASLSATTSSCCSCPMVLTDYTSSKLYGFLVENPGIFAWHSRKGYLVLERLDSRRDHT